MVSIFSSSGHVAVAGSRSLPAGGAAVVAHVCRSLADECHPLVVGCCQGTDKAVLGAVPVDKVTVFSAFGPAGQGAGPASAVAEVTAFAQAGGSVCWWSGGGPSVPLSVRLARRTRVVVSAAEAGLVVFLASPNSRGSLLAARAALSRGLPVVAVPLGFPARWLPSLGAGNWLAVGGRVSSYQWVPAQAGLFSVDQ